MDWVVIMLGRVREKGFRGIHLHLVGTREQGRPGTQYYKALLGLVAANREWVHLHENLSREDLLDLMGSCRYAIHALKDEHFGMAPAEALLSGCVPFVHNSGGQVEIVGEDPRLCYGDDDATQKIGAVLASQELQGSIRASLAARRALFSVENFMEGIRDAVRSAVRRPGAAIPLTR
jgi:glycosyltransferase involved in cell wall biosynthesis